MHDLVEFPEVALVRQQLIRFRIDDPPSDLQHHLQLISGCVRLKKNDTIAVAVGSRKIDRLDMVVKTCVDFLKERGGRPFIVPAMGSHGGATAEGQKKILAGLKITCAEMGVPIVAEMDTVKVDTFEGLNLYVSGPALEADHLVVINRIKPHTKFEAPIESGLCKMLTIGLGKDLGASEFHRIAVTRSFGIIENAARHVLKHINLLFAIGLVENGCGQLAQMEAVLPGDLIAAEKRLLVRSKQMMARIPFDQLDILIIDQIGKNISGIGMDSNVTGRHRDLTGDMFMAPHVKRIFVRDLSPASDGNANGIGLADFTTDRLVERIDTRKTFINAITAISPEKAAIPIHFPTDRECLAACAKTTGVQRTKDLRIVRITHTADLEFMWASRPLEKDIEDNSRLARQGSWGPLQFDVNGNLTNRKIDNNLHHKYEIEQRLMKKEKVYTKAFQTPMGQVGMVFSIDPFALVEIRLPGAAPAESPYSEDHENSAEIDEMVSLITDHMEGRSSRIPWKLLQFGGLSDLQAEVLRKVAEVPYGNVATYKDIAVAIGRPRACRFVGSALAKNPYPILIPCHRIIRSDMTMGGFGGGTALKKKMIDHEQQMAAALRNPFECATG